MTKVNITGLTEKYDEETYGAPLDTGDLFGVHVVEIGGDGERTSCTIDLVHGAIFEETEAPVTCKHCIRVVSGYKKIKLGKG